MGGKNKLALRLTLFLALAVTVLLVAPFFGAVDIFLAQVLDGSLNETERRILFELRLPRVLLAFLAGSSLALAGLVFQSLLRNPLATPFTLGIASGASLGSAVYIHLGVVWSLAGLSGVTWLAFVGAMVAAATVFTVARAVGRQDNITLLLSGVAVTFFFSSAILFAQYLADFTAVFKMIRWVMGGVSVVGFSEPLGLIPFAFGALALVIWKSPELNLISTGDDLAHSRGVNVNLTRLTLFAALSLVVGAAVALVGPIAFVGMMAPHMCRLLFGSDNRLLAPLTFLGGGVFLVACDTFARTALAPVELPVGIVTALIGGPFFLWILIHTKGGVRL